LFCLVKSETSIVGRTAFRALRHQHMGKVHQRPCSIISVRLATDTLGD
jgi:hypothetical protein